MGVIRTLLALLVVFGHVLVADPASRPYLGGGAVIAVHLFFVISGFYMALVLDQKYRTGPLPFYRARALRLYPLYFVTLAVTLLLDYWLIPDSFLATALRPNIEELISGHGRWFTAIAAFSNLTFLGLDYGNILCFDFASASINAVANDSCRDIAGFTVVPQAWTLGTEITFYLMIPFIFRLGWPAIIASLAIALAAKITLYASGMHHAPWDRMLFVVVLLYFMLGVAAYRIYATLRLPDLARYWPAMAVTVAVMLFAYTVYPTAAVLLAVRNATGPVDIKAITASVSEPLTYLEPITVLLFVLSVPFLFHASKDSGRDKSIGELSYPIYITHMTALVISAAFLRDVISIESGYLRLLFHLSVVLTVAIAGSILVTIPMERIRRRGMPPAAIIRQQRDLHQTVAGGEGQNALASKP